MSGSLDHRRAGITILIVILAIAVGLNLGWAMGCSVAIVCCFLIALAEYAVLFHAKVMKNETT